MESEGGEGVERSEGGEGVGMRVCAHLVHGTKGSRPQDVSKLERRLGSDNQPCRGGRYLGRLQGLV